MTANRPKFIFVAATAAFLQLPAYSEELKFPMYGDFYKTNPIFSRPAQRAMSLYSNALLVETNAKPFELEISKEWLIWQKKAAIGIARHVNLMSKTNRSYYKHIKNPCKFVIELNNKGQTLARPQITSGSLIYDTLIFGAVNCGTISKNYPGHTTYKRVTIYGSISPSKSYKISKIKGYKDYKHKWQSTQKDKLAK